MIFYRGVSKEDGERILKLQKFTVSTTEHYRKHTDMGYVYLTTDIAAALRYAVLSDSSLEDRFPCYIFKLDFPEGFVQIDCYEKDHYNLKGNYFFRYGENIDFNDCTRVEYVILKSIPDDSLRMWPNNYGLDNLKSIDWENGKKFENEIDWTNAK